MPNTLPTRDGPRVNEEIRAAQVRLIDQDGEMQGVMTAREALARAYDIGMDLLEISPNAEPPVCKITDFGKFKYEQQKKANEARKRQKVVEIKEIKVRPNIDDHDYEVKMRQMKGFIEEGDKVKVTLRFRGVVEPMMYKDGKADGDLFYVGGKPNNGTYNVYQIKVSSPESHYFLNRQDAVGHRTFKIDYTKTIEVDGGATITFHGNGQNGHLISNYDKLVVDGVSPEIKQPFHGQFVQVDVVDVAEAK